MIADKKEIINNPNLKVIRNKMKRTPVQKSVRSVTKLVSPIGKR
jgi:hypothetical protein